MSRYRHANTLGATYFFTVITYRSICRVGN